MARGLRRFFVDAIFQQEGIPLQLSIRETTHLYRVLRLKAGDACQVFNRSGLEAEAVIETVSENEGARLRLTKIFPLKKRSIFLKVAQALPQKRKMDELVRRAEELGVQELWVLKTKRTVVQMSGEARERAKNRWERIVVEAAKQSKNSILTCIEGPFPFQKVVEENLSASEPAFIFHPNPAGLPFPRFIQRLTERKDNHQSPVFLFFGPEGGFTEEEVRMAESRGAEKVYLGDSTLRIETAFIGVISAIRFMGS